MKIINGKDAILGRLAGHVAKEALKGEEIAIVNCEQIIITGSYEDIKEDFDQSKGRRGTTFNGPKVSKNSEKIVKRAIRGMLPNHREGRGKQALHRIKCYKGIPKEFENSKILEIEKIKPKRNKYIRVSDIGQ